MRLEAFLAQPVQVRIRLGTHKNPDALQPAVLSDDKFVTNVIVSKHWLPVKDDKELTVVELKVLE